MRSSDKERGENRNEHPGPPRAILRLVETQSKGEKEREKTLNDFFFFIKQNAFHIQLDGDGVKMYSVFHLFSLPMKYTFFVVLKTQEENILNY